MTAPALQRLAILVGESGIARLAQLQVAVFGVGGVGSWAAEALARSGVGHISLVDSDVVCATNINRQLPADYTTIGQPKVQVLAQRLRNINPQAKIQAIQAFYSAENHQDFQISIFDYIIDAIDSVPSKLHMLQEAHAQKVPIFSSMGAANKFDPTQIRHASIWKTSVCPLAKKIRYELRQRHFSGDFICVYS
ncbi:MAG: tRNA threonylcarbamoyladenosine dehydratase, partial [Fibrobacter sp.]|nr:tRNA threonylcarbamoyladenosine dehydratase [Fibrobacter sp.]